MYNGSPTIVIVDDEAPARERLREMLAEVGGWETVGEAANGKEALAVCAQQNPDVVLLDIRMPGMDGIELAGHLAALPTPPAVVFTTAYDEYAVKAFDAHAVGYLLKPVRREKLLKALEHAARMSRLKLNALLQENPELGVRDNIAATVAGSIQLIPVERVISFHADQKYVRMVYTAESGLQESLIDDSLKSLETELGDDFVRIHRHSLVRISAIDSLTAEAGGRHVVSLRISGDKVPVSRRHVAALKKRLR